MNYGSDTKTTSLQSNGFAEPAARYYQDQIFSDGRLPKFILIAFKNGSQCTGSFTKDTGTYKNFNITSLSLTKNSDLCTHKVLKMIIMLLLMLLQLLEIWDFWIKIWIMESLLNNSVYIPILYIRTSPRLWC